MKTYLLLLLIAAWNPNAPQNDETPIVNRPPTQAQIDAAHAVYVKEQSALPLEERTINYIANDKEWTSLTPAFIDLSTSTAYKWKEVELLPSQVPDLVGTRDGSGLIMPIYPKELGYQVKEIDPPIRYIALGDSGKYGAGYYDPSHRIFYRWGNLEYNLNQLPADAKSKNLILAPTSIVHTSSIAPPNKYAPQSPDATLQTAPNDQTSFPSDKTTTPKPAPVASAPATPTPQVQTGISKWIYAVIVFSLGLVGVLWYRSRPK